jgi:translocation and assembly module TamB
MDGRHRPGIVRRVLRIAARALAVTVLIALALAVSVDLVARTPWASEHLQSLLVRKVNHTIAGRIEVQHLALRGTDLTLDGVSLQDPQGSTVAALERVHVHVTLAALLTRTVALSVDVAKPEIWMMRTRDGQSNLALALATRTKGAPGSAKFGSNKPSSWKIRLDRFHIQGGILDLRDEMPGAYVPELRAALDAIDATLRWFPSPRPRLEVRLRLASQLEAPIELPLRLNLEGAATLGSPLLADLTLETELGKSLARLTGHLRGGSSGDATDFLGAEATAELHRLELDPREIRQIISGWPLLAPIGINGRADLAQGQASANLDLSIADATLAVAASADLRHAEVRSFKARGRDIDFAKWLAGAPRTRLGFDIDGRVRGSSPDDLDGDLRLHVPEGSVAGAPAGPVDVHILAQPNRYELANLQATLPGARLQGSGVIGRKALSLRMALSLLDLGALLDSMPVQAARVSAGGSGRIEMTVSGSPARPRAHLSARLADLSWQDTHLPKLDARLDVPDLHNPLACHAIVNTPAGQIGTRPLPPIALELDSSLSAVRLRLAVAGSEGLQLRTVGRWQSRRHLEIDRLTLATRRASWRLAQPADLSFADGEIALPAFNLSSADGQALHLSLRKRAQRVDAALELAALDIARLPLSFLYPQPLAGRLSAKIRWQQRGAVQQASGTMSLVDGRVGKVTGIDLDGTGEMKNRRAAGSLALRLLDASVQSHFDLPMVWPPPPGAALAADVTAGHIDIARLLQAMRGSALHPATVAQLGLDGGQEVKGQAQAQVILSGSWNRPELHATAKVVGLAARGGAIGDVALGIDNKDDGPVEAQLDVKQAPGPKADGGNLALHLRSRTPLRSLIDHRWSRQALMDLPFDVEMHAHGLNLRPLAKVAGMGRRLEGRASLEAAFRGPAKAAEGHLNLALAGVTSTGVPATEATLQLDLDEHAIRSRGQVLRKGTSLAAFEAMVRAPLAQVRKHATWASVPVEGHLRLGPIALRRDGLPAGEARLSARVLTGRLRAQADLGGTVSNPNLRFGAWAEDVRMDDKPIGQGSLAIEYSDRHLHGDVELKNATGGNLAVTAELDHDLGYPAVLRVRSPDQLPIKAHLVAKSFDLASFSGAATGLRSVAGQLFADITVTGTAADPRPSGRLEWKDGALTLSGLGQYKNVHLLLHGNESHWAIDEIKAESGNGNARISAEGDHREGQGYFVHGSFALDKFPAYLQGQVLARVSLDAKAEAQISTAHVETKINVASARIALTDVKRKHLQEMNPPTDVVLVDDGTPVSEEQSRKLAAVNAALLRTAEGKKHADQAAQAQPIRPAKVVLLLNAERNVWLVGKDANIEVSLQPGFRVELSTPPQIFGEVRVKRGQVDALGRRFTLKADSSLRFNGPADEPLLDITAEYVDESHNIIVVATVKGSPKHLQTHVSAPSHPDLTESQLYNLLVTGRLPQGGGSATPTTPSNQAETILGGLMAGQLQKLAASKLPFDVLTIQGGNTAGSARVEAGKYVTRNLYVGYVGRLGADPALLQNRNAVHFEYGLGSHWSFQGEYGDAKTGSADIAWTKRY